MDGVRKLEILKAEERFLRRTALAAKLAEGGVYLIGPLSVEPAAPEIQPPDADHPPAQSSSDMIAAVQPGTNRVES